MRSQLVGSDVGVLDGVVQHAGCDDLVRAAAAVQEVGNLERMQDERSPVGLALLPSMAGCRELQRTPGQGQVVDEAREAHGHGCFKDPTRDDCVSAPSAA